MPTLTLGTAHGLTMSSPLPLPVYRDEATDSILVADSLSPETHVDFYVTSITDANTLEIEFSGLF